MLFSMRLLLLAAAAIAVFAQSPQTQRDRPSALTLRKRLHVNPLITEPDTMELEYGVAASIDGSFTLPTVIHFTPEGRHVWWGRTEFSAFFDSLNSTTQPLGRITQFGDRAGFAATCVIRDGEKLDIAFAPQVSFLLRGDAGARLGATAIARYDAGRSSAGITFGWSAATASSPTNPAGTIDIGAGYGYRLKPSGPLGHLTPHVNWLYERSTGAERQISIFEGMEYQVVESFAIDFSAQQISLWGGQPDRQFVVGLTYNSARFHHR